MQFWETGTLSTCTLACMLTLVFVTEHEDFCHLKSRQEAQVGSWIKDPN